MNSFFSCYMAIWISACLTALGLLMRSRNSYDFLQIDYLRFLLKPWRLATFLVAAACMASLAPYSGDPTWDCFDSITISLMSFLTAPWATGAIYRFFIGRVPMTHAFVAFCMMLFVPCWFYDIYILLRDGLYPPTWLVNIPLSTSIYVAAGLFWNLEWIPDKGVSFAFQRDEWLEDNPQSRFSRLFGPALLFMGFVTFIIASFFLEKILFLLGCL